MLRVNNVKTPVTDQVSSMKPREAAEAYNTMYGFWEKQSPRHSKRSSMGRQIVFKYDKLSIINTA